MWGQKESTEPFREGKESQTETLCENDKPGPESKTAVYWSVSAGHRHTHTQTNSFSTQIECKNS